MNELAKQAPPAPASIAVMVVGATAPLLVGHELGLWDGAWIGAVAGFAVPALALVLLRLGWLLRGDFLSVRVVRRTGQLCLALFLAGAAVRGLGLTAQLDGALKALDVVWPVAACALVGSGVTLIAFGRDLERRSLSIFSCIILLGGLALSILVPHQRAARLRANQRACFANQKTIIGAIEMYNLDKNVKLDPSGGYTKYADELRHGGYLRNVMSDPGQGHDTAHHYRLEGPTGIRCTVHGTWTDRK